MIEINLLPWREQARRGVRRRKFLLALLVSVLLGLVLVNHIIFRPVDLTPSAMPQVQTIKLEPLQFVGFMQQGGRSWGLLLLPDGKIRDVQVHDYLAEINAHVLAVNAKNLQLLFADHHFANLPLAAS